MNKNLSRMVADLFVKSKTGEDLPSKIVRLRNEIAKIIDSDDALFGKFRGLLESFRDVIPDEKQRYHAAIKALTTTSKVNQQEITRTFNSQLEEVKILEKGLMPAIPVWRDDLKVMEAKAKDIKDEIAKLRDKIARLESEEEGIRTGMATREKELQLIEEAMKGLFADIGTEIATIKNKFEEYTTERAPVPPPVAQKAPVKIEIPGETMESAVQEVEIEKPAALQDTEFQKKCPMCGGRMNYHANEKLWMCYTCAYEELESEGQGSHAGKSEGMNAPFSAPLSDPAPTFTVPVADLSSSDFEGSEQSSSAPREQAPKSKPCPVCRKKMYWLPADSKWQCPSCHYERRI